MKHADPDEPARTAAIDFSHRLVAHWQKALGTELLGAYLIGSLAHAGFNRRYSDIDMALVTTAGLSVQVLDRLRGSLPIGGPRSRFSGPTGTSLSADFRHSIA